jgi:hypothetical protein
MALTVLSRPRTMDLTTLAVVRVELDLSDDLNASALAAENALLARYITRASRAISGITKREFARAVVRETCSPPYRTILLERYPVLGTPSVTVAGQVLTDSTLDAAAGILTLHTMPGYGSAEYQIDYTAGYLLPSDDLTSNLISARAGDPEANDNALVLQSGAFPLLVPGDVITIAGFLPEQNNGPATIVSRTADTLVLADIVLDDAPAAEDITLTVATLPADLEAVCVATVRAWFLERQWSATGPRLLQGEGGTQYVNLPTGALPKSARDMLKDFMRIV